MCFGEYKPKRSDCRFLLFTLKRDEPKKYARIGGLLFEQSKAYSAGLRLRGRREAGAPERRWPSPCGRALPLPLPRFFTLAPFALLR